MHMKKISKATDHCAIKAIKNISIRRVPKVYLLLAQVPCDKLEETLRADKKELANGLLYLDNLSVESCSPSWLQTHYLVGNNPKLLITLPLLLEYWDCRPIPHA